MAEYRICLIDAGNVVVEAPVLDYETDAAASFAGMQMAGEHTAVEIWDRTRLVSRFDTLAGRAASRERFSKPDPDEPLAQVGAITNVGVAPPELIDGDARTGTMPAIIAMEGALLTALRLMDEFYMVIVSELRRDGMTRNTAGLWQAAIDHFESGELVDQASDPRICWANELRDARVATRLALAARPR